MKINDRETIYMIKTEFVDKKVIDGKKRLSLNDT